MFGNIPHGQLCRGTDWDHQPSAWISDIVGHDGFKQLPATRARIDRLARANLHDRSRRYRSHGWL